ncbi:MAG: hypothetical protein ED859_17690 [Desulfuromonadales bacterium]|nr:MAG: hypothetical protein ED859_17690 [Desulfuromonadales bacterium]
MTSRCSDPDLTKSMKATKGVSGLYLDLSRLKLSKCRPDTLFFPPTPLLRPLSMFRCDTSSSPLFFASSRQWPTICVPSSTRRQKRRQWSFTNLSVSGGRKKFRQRWEKEIPSAVKCLEQSIESCLTYLSFPEEEWISLRTTNIIERLNKEFRRRTKTMEIVAGENACYRLLAFIALKMELSWRANRVGKIKSGLPSLKKITQKS